MKKTIALIVCAAAIVLWAVSSYNTIQTLDEKIKASWSETLNQYQRRADLIPQLVSSVNAYMVHERDVLTQITAARAKVGNMQISGDKLPSQEQLATFQSAQGELSSALSRLLVVSENYPNLKADRVFHDLNIQLEGTENRIAVARGRYIKGVQGYNSYVRKLPQKFIASWLGYDIKPNFGVENEAEIKKAPVIKFDHQPSLTQ